jgi:predicted NACHT family NTPase
MKQGESTVPSSIKPAKAKYTNPGQKKMPWKSEGIEQYNQLHEEVCQDRLSSEGQRFEIQFKNKMKQEAGVSWSRKRKTIQLVNVAAVHELDDMSSNEDSSQRSQQTRSTYGSSISSRASNPTGV